MKSQQDRANGESNNADAGHARNHGQIGHHHETMLANRAERAIRQSFHITETNFFA